MGTKKDRTEDQFETHWVIGNRAITIVEDGISKKYRVKDPVNETMKEDLGLTGHSLTKGPTKEGSGLHQRSPGRFTERQWSLVAIIALAKCGKIEGRGVSDYMVSVELMFNVVGWTKNTKLETLLKPISTEFQKTIETKEQPPNPVRPSACPSCSSVKLSALNPTPPAHNKSAASTSANTAGIG